MQYSFYRKEKSKESKVVNLKETHSQIYIIRTCTQLHIKSKERLVFNDVINFWC